MTRKDPEIVIKKPGGTEEASAPRPQKTRAPFMQMFGRFVFVLLVLALILAGGVYLIAQTPGFGYAVKNLLAKETGFPIEVEKAYLNSDLSLVVEGARVAVTENRMQGGLSVDRAVIRWSLWGLMAADVNAIRSVEVSGCALIFIPSASGKWEPASLAPLGSWLSKWIGFEVEELDGGLLGGLAAPPRERAEKKTAASPTGAISGKMDYVFPAHLSNGRITWRSLDGGVDAFLNDIDFSYIPVRSRDQLLRHLKLNVGTAKMKSGKTLREVDFELLLTPKKQVLLGFEYQPEVVRRPIKEISPPKTLEPVTPDSPSILATNAPPAGKTNTTETPVEVNLRPPKKGFLDEDYLRSVEETLLNTK